MWLSHSSPERPGPLQSSRVPVQQDGGNLPPFLIERGLWMGLVGSLIPVAGVVRIPFFAMQVGMDPGGFLPGFLFLGNLVSAVEISLGIPPKSFQQGRQGRRRPSLAQTSTEFFDGHGGILRSCGAQQLYRREGRIRTTSPDLSHVGANLGHLST